MNIQFEIVMDQRPPYGRQTGGELLPTSRQIPAMPEIYEGQTYYDRRPIKPGHYGQLISAYFFIGGLAGGSQILAALADLFGDEKSRSIVRNGRYLALFGSAASPILLIADLETPRRWYNMLRIFRPTSAMSIGSWTLAAFGTLSGMTAVAQALEDLTGLRVFRRVGRWFGLPAGVLGAPVSIYTGVLIGSTSNPFWAAASKSLPALFGTSAMTTATAALSLAEHLRDGSSENTRNLEKVALVSSAAELAASSAAEYHWRSRRVETPLKEEPTASLYRIGFHALGVLTPLAIHAAGTLTGRRWKTASIVASVAALAGGYALRSFLVHGGKRSAQAPQDYFRFTQPAPEEMSQPQPEMGFERKKPSTLAEMWEKAMSILERSLNAPAEQVGPEIDEAENMVAAMRDSLIDRLRSNGDAARNSRYYEALGRVNAALSYIVGVEYPTSGVLRESVEKARDALKEVPSDAFLQ